MIFESFPFFLIAGIFSSAIAFGRTDTSVPSHLRFLGYLNTTIADIEKYDEDMCTKIGGVSAYNEQKKSWTEMSTCMITIGYEVSRALKGETFSSTGESSIARLKQYCNRISNVENCFKDLTNSMKSCLDPEKHESANVIYNTISSIFRYWCENDGSHFIEYEVADGEECINSKYVDLASCMNQTVAKYIQNTVSNGAAIGGLGALHLLVADSEKCTILNNLRVCAVNVLKKCDHPTPANILNSIFNLLNKATTCDHFLKSQASPIPVVNILLMTVVAAMYLPALA